MAAQIVRTSGAPCLRRYAGDAARWYTLLPKNTGVERRVRQRANAEDKIGRIPVRVDKVIGQRQLNA
jgi:hypothetical protein